MSGSLVGYSNHAISYLPILVVIIQPMGVGDIVAPTGVSITSPEDCISDVSLTPTITCSAGSDDTPPISYYFQLDTVATFDSGNLQESGWQESTSWSPAILQAATYYYVRVKARDSVAIPNVSSYSDTTCFLTKLVVYEIGKIILADNTSVTVNGDFEEQDTTSWIMSLSGTGAATFTATQSVGYSYSYGGVVDISDGGADIFDVQIFPSTSGTLFVEGNYYLFSFCAKASASKQLHVACTDVACKTSNYGLSDTTTATTDWQKFTYIFKMLSTSSASFNIFMGGTGTVVTLDDAYVQEALNVFPTYEYRAKQISDRKDYRTSHQLYSYSFSTHKEWEIPETWVNSWSRSVVNSWQGTNTQLRLIENSSFPGSYELVRILNLESPYPTYQYGSYLSHFNGELRLGKVSRE